MKSRFPDLTFFLDVGGRYSHSKETPIVFAAVAVETKAVDEVRESLLAAVKGSLDKWAKSQSGHEGAKSIFRLLAKRQLYWVVRIIWKDTPEWDRYFTAGQQLYDKGVKSAQEPMSYAKPMNTFKLHQFGLVSAELLGFYLRQHRNRLPTKGMPDQQITVTGIFDSDIQGQTNQEMCQKVFAGIQGGLPNTVQATRVKPDFNVSIKTEQEEPLLLLADHIAGYFYSRGAYGLPEENNWGGFLSAIEPLVEKVPACCRKIIEEHFQDEYLLPSTTFDHVLPKKERDAVLEKLVGAQGAAS